MVTKTSYFRMNSSDVRNLWKDFCYRSMRDRLFFSSLLGSSRSGVNIANKWSTNLSPIHFLLATLRDFVHDVCFLDFQRISNEVKETKDEEKNGVDRLLSSIENCCWNWDNYDNWDNQDGFDIIKFDNTSWRAWLLTTLLVKWRWQV